MKRFLFLLFLATAASAEDLQWQPLDQLGGGDRILAEQTLYEMFGDNPDWWPDWIDPAALYAPAKPTRMLVVRRPIHEPCGQYKFAIFSPVNADRQRDKLGDFCAGSIQVIPVSGRDQPDFLIEEGRIPDQEGIWQRLDQRVRWHDGQWWRVLSP